LTGVERAVAFTALPSFGDPGGILAGFRALLGDRDGGGGGLGGGLGLGGHHGGPPGLRRSGRTGGAARLAVRGRSRLRSGRRLGDDGGLGLARRGGVAVLPVLNGGDQLALTHPADTGNAQTVGELL